MTFLLLNMLCLVLMVGLVTADNLQPDPAADQLEIFKNKTTRPVAIMTTAAGAPIHSKETNTLNKRLIFNEFFMESLTHFDRERIPERVVHAKGAGAFGYFEVSHDVTDICKAKFLSEVGKRTPVAVRFSTVFGEIGASDTPREPRGFAVKFYTEEGNFDIVGLDIPVFALKDPVLFPSFVRAQKRNPATFLKDPNMLWDYITLNPESMFLMSHVFSDRGIPDGYRYLPGFGIHTYQVVNKVGEKYFVRFHFVPDLGLKTLESEEASIIAGIDPDYSIRDLYKAIGKGNFPTWTMAVQVLTANDVNNAAFNVFDVTKELPLDKYPLRPIGRLVLDKNPLNYFAEIEQLAFSPANLVPGILGAPDKLFEARRLSYRDTQYHRLGSNFLNIPVNCPFQTRAFTYNRDGQPPVNDNMYDIPNYYPNSFNGPIPYEDNAAGLIDIEEEPSDNFEQIREFYVNGLQEDEKQRLVDNILYSLGSVTTFLQERALKLFAFVHPEFKERVCHGLLKNKTESDFIYKCV